MKKICYFLLIIVIMFNMVACKTETVMLQCDGEKCNNKVEVKVNGKETPNDKWIVFCESCAENDLTDN